MTEEQKSEKKGLPDPAEIGIVMLSVCDKINESRDLLSADIREFMTKAKELNGLYAQRCTEVSKLEKLVGDLQKQITDLKKQLASPLPDATKPESSVGSQEGK